MRCLFKFYIISKYYLVGALFCVIFMGGNAQAQIENGCMQFDSHQTLEDGNYVPVGVSLKKEWNITNNCGEEVNANDVKLQIESFTYGPNLELNQESPHEILLEYSSLEQCKFTPVTDNKYIVSTIIHFSQLPPDSTDNIERVKLTFTLVAGEVTVSTLSTDLYLVNIPEEADVFDLPIGNRGYVGQAWVPYRESFGVRDSYSLNQFANINIVNDEETELKNPYIRDGNPNTGERWYNRQDVCSRNWYDGYHQGEDWNYLPNDVGQEVYAAANGVIIKNVVNKGMYDGQPYEYGQYIVVMHKLSRPIKIYPYGEQTFSYVFSGYTHLNNDLYTTPEFLDVVRGRNVERGMILGKLDGVFVVPNNGSMGPHLHFEMMTTHQEKYKYGNSVYPLGTGENSYLMNFAELKKFGIFDPSDFINATHNFKDNVTYENDVQLPDYPYYGYPQTSFSKHQVLLSPVAGFANPVKISAVSDITLGQDDEFVILADNINNSNNNVFYPLGKYGQNFDRLDGMSVFVPSLKDICKDGTETCEQNDLISPAMNKVIYKICKTSLDNSGNLIPYPDECVILTLEFDETLTTQGNIAQNTPLLHDSNAADGFSQKGNGKATFLFKNIIGGNYQFQNGEFYSIVASRSVNDDENGVALGKIRVFGNFIREVAILPFPDIWYSDYQTEIINLYALGIVKGNDNTGTFTPEKLVNRAEFAKMLVLTARYAKYGHLYTQIEPISERENVNNIFPDVETDSWYEEFVDEAYKADLIDGYDNGYFGPTNNILRCEGMKMVVDTFHLFEDDVLAYNLPQDFFGKYQDMNTSEWFTKYVARCDEIGIIEEYSSNSNLFEPGRPMRKDEAAALIYRAYLKYNQ